MQNPIPQSLTFQLDNYASVLQTSLANKDPFTGRLVHARIIKSGLHLGVFLMNTLVNYYAKTGFISNAHKLFDEMPDKNTSSWNTVLSAYAKEGSLNSANRLFRDMPEPDAVSWTSMIVGYNQMGRFEFALKMFLDMISCRVLPSQYTLTNVLASCAAIKEIGIGRKVHSFVVKVGLSSYTSVGNSLLNMYAKSGDPETAKIVFTRMTLKSVSSWNTMISMHMQCGQFDLARSQFERMSTRDNVSWNSMISGYSQHGFDFEALCIFSRMLHDSLLKPDKYSLASALSACANLEDLKLGKQIHGHIIRVEFDTSGPAANALISMYSKSGGVEIAQKIIEQNMFSDLNVIAFTSLLDGYIKLGDIHPAREIFDSLGESKERSGSKERFAYGFH